MPDDLRIPDVAPTMRERASLSSGQGTGGYRPRRAASDRGPDLVKIAAAGVGGLLLLGVIGYSVLGRHASSVPVIEADSRPIRVKPDNPGGMQIAGADELTLSDDRTSHDRMAPAAEVPAPQALRAQMQQVTPPAATPAATPAPMVAPMVTGPAVPAPLVPAAPPTPTKNLAASAGASPLPDTQAQPAIKTPSIPAPAKLAEKETPKETGRPAETAAMVQMGALSSEAAARAEWQRLSHSVPGLLDGKAPTITKVERDGHTYWRLRTGGFADIADATAFCGKLKAKGGSCAIASF